MAVLLSPKLCCYNKSLISFVACRPNTARRHLTLLCPAKPRNLARRALQQLGVGLECPPVPPEQVEVIRSLDGWVRENMLPLLTPVEASWQPQDFLPDAADGFREGVAELQARAAGVPDDFFVCLVGNMVTEEALPTYQSMANRAEGARDETGRSARSWPRWIRGWTAEENRHGDLLNRYLYLSGRVDMRQVEKTVHYLILDGMEMHVPNSPYHGIIYGSFQERATFISHANMAKCAGKHGDRSLARICGAIAADEKRHEAAYAKVTGKLFEVDPDATVQALACILRGRVTMPGQLMSDGRDGDMFAHFSSVAQRTGVYTARDYGDMVEHFVKRWGVAEIAGLSGEGRRAQDYVCGLPQKIRRMEERAYERAAQKKPILVPFSWVFDRPVLVA